MARARRLSKVNSHRLIAMLKEAKDEGTLSLIFGILESSIVPHEYKSELQEVMGKTPKSNNRDLKMQRSRACNNNSIATWWH